MNLEEWIDNVGIEDVEWEINNINEALSKYMKENEALREALVDILKMDGVSMDIKKIVDKVLGN